MARSRRTTWVGGPLSRTKTLHVEPEVLHWARTSAGVGLADAATSLGIEPELLARWEAAEATPTARQLEHLADRYKRPVVLLLMEKPPADPALPPDFRRNARRSEGGLGEDSRLAIRRARRLQRLFRSLSQDADRPKMPPLPSHLREDAEAAAAYMRSKLGISIETQLSWRDPDAALPKWRATLEDAGVLVLRLSMPPSELRAFSLAGAPPLVSISSRDAAAAQSFSLLHEWCHLLLGQAALCRPNEMSRRLRGDDEVFCNAFAGAFLVPMAALLPHPVVERLRIGDTDPEHAASALGRAFSVSRFVILRRLLTASLVSNEDYGRIAAAWLKQPSTRRKGFAHPAVRAVSQLGRPLVRAIALARKQGTLSDLDAATYLNVAAAHLGRVEDLAGV